MNIGIYGYGNLGRAVEIISTERSDVNVKAVFTRRNTDEVRTLGAPVYARGSAKEFVSKIDCMILCGGSYDDLREDTPTLAEHFNTVDSFDTHRLIGEHRERVNAAATKGHKSAVVSAGWDPGLLSMFRSCFSSVLPHARINTFWGRGVSQGHSEAVRRLKGVKRAVEYTVPKEDAIILALTGKSLKDSERHRRVCYVVADDEGDKEKISESIKSMPEYFAGYDTEVNFISEERFIAEHCCMPHKGEIIAHDMSGVYGEHIQRARVMLELDSNPEFTASVMLAYAKAAVRLAGEGSYGARTVLDIPLSYIASSDVLKFL